MRQRKLCNNIVSRLMSLVLAAVLMLCMIPAVSAEEAAGSCGADLSWSFADGTLTITGSGAMTDYSDPTLVPWYGFRDQIHSLSLPEGLTRVGNMAFYDCYKLTSVTLPSTVTAVGDLAFCRCSAVTILRLNEGLQTIGESAFERCEALADLRLPTTVTTLGRNAFSLCESLTYVTVPASITNMGAGVFSFCEGLIRAEIYAPLTQLPRRTFYGCLNLTSISLPAQTTSLGVYCVYGCGNLSVVYYGGEAGNAEELHAQITEDVADQGATPFISNTESENSELISKVETDESGAVIVEDTTVIQTDETTITITTTTNVTDTEAETPPTDITATVVDQGGWDQVVDSVEDAILDGPVDVTVYVPGDADVPQSVVESLAGSDVIMSVQTGSGSSYTLDFSVIDRPAEEAEAEAAEPLKLDLSYLLFSLDGTDYPELEGAKVYRLDFTASSTVPAEIMIQLPVDISRRNATLFQIEEKDGLTNLQSVVTDNGGRAHFFLASVDSETEYLIGIDVPGISLEGAIIPENMHAEYGIDSVPVYTEYVITGRTSSWGMSLGQVTWILAAVMIGCMGCVGAFMFVLNKRKLRRGYVPEIYDEEE